MKIWIIAGLILFAAALYFIVFPDTRVARAPEQPAVSSDNLFFAPKAVALPFGEDGIEYGEKLVTQKNYDDAVSVFGTVLSGETPVERKELAMRMAGLALMQKNTDDSRRHAREVFETYLNVYADSTHADAAHYYLGAMAAEDKDAATALAHFTTISADFPDSGFAQNAAIYSKNLATILEKQDNAFKGKVLRAVGPLIPRNPAGLGSLLGYIVTILGWIVYDWKKVSEKLFKEKHPAAWLVLILSVVLIAINYTSEWRNTSKLLQIPSILQPLKR